MGKEEIRVRYGAREDSTYTFSLSDLGRLYWRYNQLEGESDNGPGVIPNKKRLGNICQTIETLLEIKESNSEMDIEIDIKFLSKTVGVTEPIMRSYIFSIYLQRKRTKPLSR